MTASIYALPGWGYNAEIFSQLNTERLKFIGVDYIDHSAVTLSELARSLALSLPDSSIICAWSFSGLIAIKIAKLFPKKIKKLIFISSQPRFLADSQWCGIKKQYGEQFFINAQNNFEQTVNYFLQLSSYPSRSAVIKTILSSSILYQKTEKLIMLLPLLLFSDLRDDYSKLDIEIIHFISERDAVLPQNPSHIKSLNENAKFCLLEGLGHSGFLHPSSNFQQRIAEYVS